jgi:hypothetical protein
MHVHLSCKSKQDAGRCAGVLFALMVNALALCRDGGLSPSGVLFKFSVNRACL